MIVRYVGRRLFQAAFVLWLVATFTFAALHWTPGDPAQALLAASGASPEEIALRRAQLGLDDPWYEQYARYWLAMLRGDWGESWLHGRSVVRMIAEQMAATVELTLTAMTVGVALGMGLGMLAAMRRSTWVDSLATALAVIGLSTPTYWSGLLAILLFSLRLHWLPAVGAGDWRHLVLPSLVLGFALSGSIARMVRSRVIEVMDEQFVLAARARGLSGRRVFLVHILRPALPAVLMVIAMQFGFLLDGAVVTEMVFARRGLGRLAMQAIFSKDMPVIRGIVVLGALTHVLTNLLADVAQTLLDPRLQEAEG